MQIESLINDHKDSVYRQMVRVCGNHDDAEDALASAIYSALKASDQLRDSAAFRAWLATIGTRACSRMRIRSHLAQMMPLSELEERGFAIPDSEDLPDVAAETATLKACIAGAVEQLPDIYKEVYLRREIAGDSASEVTRDLGITLPALKSRLHRARQLVRNALDSGFGCANLGD